MGVDESSKIVCDDYWVSCAQFSLSAKSHRSFIFLNPFSFAYLIHSFLFSIHDSLFYSILSLFYSLFISASNSSLSS